MARSGKENPGLMMVAEDLEPYRRLVELQKQMIELAEQHEQTKRKRDALRELMAHAVPGRSPGHRGLRHRLQRSAVQWLKHVPGFANGKSRLDTVSAKQPLSC